MAKFVELTLTNGKKVMVDKEKIVFFNQHIDGVKEYTAIGSVGSTQPMFVTEQFSQVRRMLSA